jgi:hypothetical protein
LGSAGRPGTICRFGIGAADRSTADAPYLSIVCKPQLPRSFGARLALKQMPDADAIDDMNSKTPARSEASTDQRLEVESHQTMNRDLAPKRGWAGHSVRS